VGLEFCDLTSFPPSNLYADPTNAVYTALNLEKSVQALFFSPKTPLSLANRVLQGRFGDLAESLAGWKVWIPPKLSQGLQQGGVLVFEGKTAVFQHKDMGTGAFADLQDVLDAAAPKGSTCDAGGV